MSKTLYYSFFLLWTFAFLQISVSSLNSSYTKGYIGHFEEWTAKSKKSKPDQIKIDPFDENIIWFTQPSNHGVSRFNYGTGILLEFTTDIKYRPDGLTIDEDGILWFGEQSAGTLGKFDPVTEQFSHYMLPYEDANPAIPTVDSKGNIWVSDHQNNKIIEFDKKTEKFRIIELPTHDSFVIDLKEDKLGRMWYTCYKANKIGFISKDRKTLTEYDLPLKSMGPSFLAIDDRGKIWISLWKSNKIASLSLSDNTFVFYELPVYKPDPAAIAFSRKDSRIYFAARHINAIIMLDLKDPTKFYSFELPTANAGQKDGITIDSRGIIWFTEFSKNKFGRLSILPSTKDTALASPGNSSSSVYKRMGEELVLKQSKLEIKSVKTHRVKYY